MPRLLTKSTQYIMVVGQIHVPLIKVRFLKRREQFPPREAFGSGVSSLHQHHAHTEGTLSLTWRSAVRARVVSRLFHEIQNALSVLLRRGHCPREINPPVTVLSVAPQAVARAANKPRLPIKSPGNAPTQSMKETDKISPVQRDAKSRKSPMQRCWIEVQLHSQEEVVSPLCLTRSEAYTRTPPS